MIFSHAIIITHFENTAPAYTSLHLQDLFNPSRWQEKNQLLFSHSNQSLGLDKI